MHRTYVISLTRRQDRRERITQAFQTHQIPFQFWDAIDGQTLEITPEILHRFRGNDFEEWGIIPANCYAANLTHLQLLEKCRQDNCPYMLFEDDTQVIQPIDFDWDKILSRTDLDIFWLCRQEPTILCYIVWPQGAQKILDHINSIPLDQGLDWKYLRMREQGLVNWDILPQEYFHQIPGYDSDIAPGGYQRIQD